MDWSVELEVSALLSFGREEVVVIQAE